MEIKKYGSIDYSNFKTTDKLPLFIKESHKNNDAGFGVSRHQFFFWLYCGGYILYLLFGASLFCYLEAPGEIDLIISLQHSKRQFLVKYPNVQGMFLFKSK